MCLNGLKASVMSGSSLDWYKSLYLDVFLNLYLWFSPGEYLNAVSIKQTTEKLSENQSGGYKASVWLCTLIDIVLLFHGALSLMSMLNVIISRI